MASKVRKMILFPNGNIAAFDENDEQIPASQRKSAIVLWAQHATELGFDVDGCECVAGKWRCVIDLDGSGWRESPIV